MALRSGHHLPPARSHALRPLSVGAILLSVALQAGPSVGSELVYQPVNPAFGGNPLNGTYLLNNAQAQNDFEDDTGAAGLSGLGRSPTQDFQRQITSRLLSRVSSEIADRILGESAEESGTFRVEDTVISFERVGGEVILNIQDGLTGETTVIQVPVPTF